MKRLVLGLSFFLMAINANSQVYNWSKSIDGLNAQQCQDIAVDNAGNTYSAGFVAGVTDISGDNGISTSDEITVPVNTYTGLILKYNSNGVRQWAAEFPGVQLHKITVVNNETYFVGRYSAALTFTSTSQGLESFSAPTMGEDLLIGKLNSNGTIHSLNVLGSCSGTATDIHLTDNQATLLVSVAGTMNGGIIDGTNYSAGSFFGNNGVLISLDPATDFSVNWFQAFQQGFDSEMSINGIGTAVDPTSGNPIIILGGTFSATIDMDPGASTTNISSTLWGGFIAKYALSNGQYLGHAVIGAEDYNYINTLKVSEESNAATIYIGGQNNASCDFDPSAGVVNLTNIESNEGFVAAFDLNLNYLRAISLRGLTAQKVNDLSVTKVGTANHISVIGTAADNLYFETTSGVDTLHLANAGASTGFVLTLTDNGTTLTGSKAFLLESATSISQTRTIATPRTFTTSEFPIGINFALTSANSVDLNGSLNTALYTNTSSPTYYADWLIGTYTNVECANAITLNETACGSFLFDGTTLTTSGTYSANYTNINGCDSTVTLNLIINPIPVATVVLNADLSITASPSSMNYTWFNCTTNATVAGQTTDTFTPSTDDSYGVIVTSNQGCADTSSCVIVEGLGINEALLNELVVFPNPSYTGNFTIETGSTLIEKITVFNMAGSIVYMQETASSSHELHIQSNSGVYLLQIQTATGTTQKRIMIE